MKVTLKEIAELLGAKNTAAESGLNSFAIGQEVIIRTYSAGVWFGRLKEKSGNEVILTEARRMWLEAIEIIPVSGKAAESIRTAQETKSDE